MNHITDLCNFLDLSPVNFWAVETVRQRLETAGFRQLDMRDEWVLTPGDKRYVVQNGSAIFAFVVGSDDAASGFNIIAAHSDSPGFRIKPRCEMACEGMVKLNTEVYGGPILYTWFDRPLSIAGRVALRGDDPLRPRMRLLRFDDPLLVIPHLAIHFNRQVNEGNPLSKQRDMLPVMALNCDNPGGMLRRLVAENAGVDIDDILDYDLSLYTCQKAGVVGLEGEMLCSGRIDDLSMVHAGMTAMLDTCDKESAATRVLAVFDNEETGSGTKQGAASPVLRHIAERVCAATSGDTQDLHRALARSFMISADDAHGWHPNYNEKYDPTNHPVLGGGPVVKINANCKYMTDARGASVFNALCREAGVNMQYFVNHADVAGGSTLGNISSSQLDIDGVDVGCAIWAMHSARETAAVSDHLDMIKVFRQFLK